MKRIVHGLVLASMLLVIPAAVLAQSDPHGIVDTAYADVSRIDTTIIR